MSQSFSIEDLSAIELKAALEADPDLSSDEEFQAVEDFIERVGGIENALLAVRLLEELEEAA